MVCIPVYKLQITNQVNPWTSPRAWRGFENKKIAILLLETSFLVISLKSKPYWNDFILSEILQLYKYIEIRV